MPAPTYDIVRTDTLFDPYWDLRKVGAVAALERIGSVEPVVVAVVDSGVDVANAELAPYLWVNSREEREGLNGVDDDGNGVVDDIHGARFIGDRVDGDVRDEDGHGTLLCGTIAGVARQKLGLGTDVPPIKLMAVKFFDPSTLPASENAAPAIRYAIDQGADIITASWDVGIQTAALAAALEYAEARGVLVVAAAGNFGSDNDRLPTWPASTPLGNMLAVMATDERDERAGFSNFGRTTVHLGAPGVEVMSTARSFTGPRWLPYWGTSPACAHVAGAAALLKALNPSWTAEMLKTHLMRSASPVPGLECVAEGRLDLRRALAGPLAGLTLPQGKVWKAGEQLTVSWDRLYETPGCRTVSLLLSEDGGRRFGVILAEDRPNTGTCLVQLPARSIPQARLRLTSDQSQFSTDSEIFAVV